MPFNKIDAVEKQKEFLKKHPEQKYPTDALDRFYEIRKSLVEYRKKNNISLKYISENTLLSQERLKKLEIGMNKNLVDYLLYARALGLSLYLRFWEE